MRLQSSPKRRIDSRLAKSEPIENGSMSHPWHTSTRFGDIYDRDDRLTMRIPRSA
jgi:hypothetical protein